MIDCTTRLHLVPKKKLLFGRKPFVSECTINLQAYKNTLGKNNTSPAIIMFVKIVPVIAHPMLIALVTRRAATRI